MEEDWLDRTSFVASLGAVVDIVATFCSQRKPRGWWRPISISTATLDGWSSDQAIGTITNIGADDQVLVECSVRTAYLIRAGLFKHARRPLTAVWLHSTIWLGAISSISRVEKRSGSPRNDVVGSRARCPITLCVGS